MRCPRSLASVALPSLLSLLAVACDDALPAACPSGSKAVGDSCRPLCSRQEDCLAEEMCDPAERVCVRRTTQADGGSSTPGDIGFKDAGVEDAVAADAIGPTPVDATFRADASSRDAGGGGPDAGGFRDAGPPGDNFDPSQRSREYVTAVCGYWERCEPARLAVNALDASTCTADQLPDVAAFYAAYAEAIAAGRARFSAPAFERCINAFASVNCVRDDPMVACEEIFEGFSPNGVPCSLTIECTQETYCTAPLGGCGTCSPRANVGGLCNEALCRRALECVRVSGSEDRRCAPRARQGQPCGTINTGVCVGHLDCAGPNNSKLCTDPLGPNAVCNPTDVASGLMPDCDVFLGLTCAEAQCQAVHYGSVGSMCGTATAQCNVTARCDENGMGTCRSLPGEGEPCDPMTQPRCEEGLFCAGRSCARLKQQDEPCLTSAMCRDPLFCARSTPATMQMTCQEYPWVSCP